MLIQKQIKMNIVYIKYISKTNKDEYSIYQIYTRIFSFKRIHSDTELNYFGTILFVLFQIIVCPIAATAFFIYWLCHKKEK